MKTNARNLNALCIKCGNNIVDSRRDHNKKLYGKEIKELLFLIETEERDEFVLSMYNALNGGRNITDKMLSAIHNIIKVYLAQMNSSMKISKIISPTKKLRPVRGRILPKNHQNPYKNVHPLVLFCNPLVPKI